jgi:hypothetical protein
MVGSGREVLGDMIRVGHSSEESGRFGSSPSSSVHLKTQFRKNLVLGSEDKIAIARCVTKYRLK